jgi:hypothetical protein
MTKYALALALVVAMAAATVPTAAWPAPDSHSRRTAPFAPKATVNRLDCWIKEDLSNLADVVTGCVRD